MRPLRRLYTLFAVPLALGCGLSEPLNHAEELGTRADGLDTPVVKAVFANNCGNSGTAPQFFRKDIMSPQALLPGGVAPQNWNPQRGRITRGGIEYVSSDGLRFELVTDGCTYIQDVRVGSRVVTPTYTDGFWYSAQPSIPAPTEPNRVGYNLWIFFPRQLDGQTDTVSITVGRVGGVGTVTHSFPMVRVESVQAQLVNAPIAFSEGEFHNMFAKSLWTKFNGATNSAIVVDGDGDQRRIYGYDPKSLMVDIDSGGVAFQFKFKIDLNNWCDPTVKANGRFKLIANSSGISVDWVNQAKGDLSWPFLCQAAELVPIAGLIAHFIYNVIEEEAGNSVLGSVEDAVTEALPDTGNANLFLNGSSSRSNELLVNLRVGVPSVQIRVPYDVFDLPRSGTAFAGGETIGLVAEGLGLNEIAPNVTPQTTVWSGPNGLPKTGTTSFANPRTLTRTQPLVWNDAPVARLLARSQLNVFQTATYQYEPGCAIKTSDSILSFQGPIRFGVNDSVADAQRVRGVFGAAPGYSLRALFLTDLPNSLEDQADRCKSFIRTTGVVGTFEPLVSP